MIRRESNRISVARLRADEETAPVSSVAALDTWTSYDWSHGLDLTTMACGAVVEVVTARSVYYITATDGPKSPLRVRGGCYLPEFRHAASIGSTMGGALLKQNMVHVGFRMELAFDDLRLITSQVTAVRLLPEQMDR
jgi:hypothetical protein